MEAKDPHTESHLKKTKHGSIPCSWMGRANIKYQRFLKNTSFFGGEGSTTLPKVIYKIPIIIFIDTERCQAREMTQWGEALASMQVWSPE